MIKDVYLFGAVGDLARRHLWPALAELEEHEVVPDLHVVGLGRRALGEGEIRETVGKSLDEHAHVRKETRARLLKGVGWARVDASHPDEVPQALGKLGEPALAYLALPPAAFAPAIEGLGRAHLPAGSAVVVEKPFGTDLESARRLNQLLSTNLPHCRIFRMDHFLGKQTVQNVLGVRFANRLFEPVWNAMHVESVEITWDETLGLEGRAEFYDATGALKDVVQNHLLQLLALVAMEVPRNFTERELRDHKVQVLRAVRRLSRDEVRRFTRRARYTAGEVEGRKLPSYADEQGVDASRGTETFAEVTLHVDNWRWADVPFVLRTGKALGRARREIAVHFRPVPKLPFDGQHPYANVLRFALAPDRVALGLNINGPGDPFDLERIELEATLADHPLPAYARLIQDALEGDPTLSIRGDEAEESWKIIDPIVSAWQAGEPPLFEYAAGSRGPEGG